MDNWFLLYLLTRLDAIAELLQFVVGAGVCCFLACIVVGAMMKMDDDTLFSDTDIKAASLFKWAKHFAIAIAVAGIAATIIPTKNDVFFIAGGSALIEAAHSDTAKRIGSKSLEAVESWLDQNMPKKEPAK